ncbi:MAG: PocR ligand-binding domain-containing protein [Desulfobacterales bacterium]
MKGSRIAIMTIEDIKDRKLTEQTLCKNEKTVRKKLKAILEPQGDLGTLDLADIIDCESLQSMMEDFYRVTNIGTAIVDLKGKILVAVGWQDVCVKFHRVHPETLKNCIESDIILTKGVPAGTYKTYRCKNNMWDMATPIEIDGRHLGNLFLGQFFYENEIPDYDLFRKQARQYGFDEKEYLAAIDSVPRWSHESVNAAMAFCAKLAKMISSLSYSTIRLSRVLSQQEETLHKLGESEERLRLARMATNDVIWDWDIINDSQQWNESGEGVFGWTDIEKYPQPPAWWVKRVHPEDRQRIEEGFFAVVDNPARNRWQDEFRFQRADGSYAQVLDRGYVMRNSQGRAIRMIGAMLDVTERIEAEEQLKKLNETLEQQVAERTALANMRAKQLQALTVELVEAEEKERRRVAEFLHEDLQQVLAGAKLQLQVCHKWPSKEMLADVEQMLEESIKKSRQLSHELSPPMLYQFGLVSALKWLVHQMDEHFGLKIQLEIKVEQQFENESLKICMFRAVQELLLNVIKHAGVKSARLILSGTGDYFVITVSDQGCGFDPDILNNSNNKTRFGLITIKERASYIGGSLTIESTPGKGSSFTLAIPLSLSNQTKLHVQFPVIDPESRTSELPETSDSGKIRVLFADDHEVMRQGLIQLINDQPDIQVVGEAANGLEAVDQARRLKPDVVVMDVSMPEMNGIDATRRIKSELPEICVIGLSMYEDELIVRAMSEAGAEGFVSKAAPAAELLKAITGLGLRISKDLK